MIHSCSKLLCWNVSNPNISKTAINIWLDVRCPCKEKLIVWINQSKRQAYNFFDNASLASFAWAGVYGQVIILLEPIFLLVKHRRVSASLNPRRSVIYVKWEIFSIDEALSPLVSVEINSMVEINEERRRRKNE